MTSKKLKPIAVDVENYKKLQKLGIAGESFNDVVSRLLSTHTKRISREGGSYQLTPHDDNSNAPDVQSGKLPR